MIADERTSVPGVLTKGADGASSVGDGVDGLLHRAIGRWVYCPLWALRGTMLTATEKVLLMALFDFWHSAGRPQWFYAANRDLARIAGLSYSAFLPARAKLLKKCLITSQPGKRGRPSLKSVSPATAYRFSQDFLYQLTKEEKSPLLKTSTSTYSVVRPAYIIPKNGDR